MLAHREDAAIFKAAGKGNAMARHQLGVGAIGTRTHHGARPVDNVKHRGKVNIHPQSLELACNLPAIVVEHGIVAYCTQIKIAGKLGRILQAHRGAPLGVEGDEQRHLGQRLGIVGDLGLRHDVALVENEASHTVLTHQFLHSLAGNGVARVDRHDKELRNALVGGHGVELLVDPCVHCTLVDLVENRRLALGAGCSRDCEQRHKNQEKFL